MRLQGAAHVLFWGWGADHTGVFSLRKFIELIDALLCMYVIKSFKIKRIISLSKRKGTVASTLNDSTNHTQ